MDTQTASPATSSAPSSSPYNPASRPEKIDSLISGVDRYNPHNLPLLQEYLEDQLKDKYEWDCMAALAILKLFQFNPTSFSYPLVTLMLAKSLHALPSPHFGLCLSLLGEAPVSILAPAVEESTEKTAENGEEVPSEEPVAQPPSAGILTDATIVKLHHLAGLLSSSRYPTFWSTLQTPEYADVQESVLSQLEHFDDGVRKVVLNGTASAFRSISRKRLSSYLGLPDGTELDQFLQSSAPGWQVRGDGVVEIPANKDNQVAKASGVVREDVGLGDLTKLLHQAAPSTALASAARA
ncbi:unnamed protein product [Parajaminaea phylloscopi]